eukprot:321850_1
MMQIFKYNAANIYSYNSYKTHIPLSNSQYFQQIITTYTTLTLSITIDGHVTGLNDYKLMNPNIIHQPINQPATNKSTISTRSQQYYFVKHHVQIVLILY